MLSITLKEQKELYIDLMDGINPSITVGDLFSNGPICIRIKKVRSGKQVQVGVDAPQELRILRGELLIPL